MTVNPYVIGSRYQLQRQLGMGGMGAVYRAFDRLSQKTVALKRVLAAADNDVNMRLALAREFQTLASLRHPHIIAVQDYGFDDDQRPYFVMPLLENSQTFKEAAQRMSDAGKVRLLIQLLQALAYLHRRGIMHRDLKPANVLVTPEGTVQVLDFGLAAEADKARDVAGTLLYMAPEVLQMKGYSPASDIFAVGVMAYEVFANVHPFDDDSPSRLVNNLIQKEPDLQLVPDLDVDLTDDVPSLRVLVSRMLAKDPRARYQDATQVVHDLSRAVLAEVPAESPAIRESFLQAARFVGRDAELTTLNDALSHTIAGRGSLWLLEGESGVGKTRLMNELRHYALLRGALVLRGQETPDADTPFALWREPVRRMILHTPVDALQASILQAVAPDIGHILNQPVQPAPRLDARDEQQRLAAAIAGLFAQAEQPVLLLIEDIHWSRESLEPLELLQHTSPGARLMVVASARSDEPHDLRARLPQYQRLPLRRLDETATEALIVGMVGQAATSTRLVEFIRQETEGNAFFIVEALRTLAAEAGRLAEISTKPLPARIFSGGIGEVSRRRLARLGEAYMPLLRLAALIGRTIDLKLMAAIDLPSPVTLDDWLTQCANQGTLEMWDERWRFSHDKLREAAAEDIPADLAITLHRHIAEGMERVYPGDTACAHALADHWRAAGDAIKEAHYAAIAGESALLRGAFATAKDLLTRALQHPQEGRSAALRKLLGDACEGLALYDEATASYQASQALAHTAGDTAAEAAALEGLGRIHDRRGDYDQAEATYTQALTLARQAQALPQIADLLNGSGTVAARRGQFAAASALFAESLALRRSLDDRRGIAASLNNLGIVANYQGDYAAARPYYEEALEIRRRIGDLRGVAGSLNNLAMLTRSMKNPREARAYYLEAVRITRSSGDLYSTATVLYNLGVVLLEDEEYREAARMYEEALKIAEKIGHTLLKANALQSLGRAAALQGSFAEAERLLAESIALHRSLGSQRDLADSLREMGHMCFVQERYEAALPYLEEALGISRTIGDKAGAARSQTLIGALAYRRQDYAAAQASLKEALTALHAANAQVDLLYALMRWGDMANQQGNYALSAALFGFLRAAETSNARLRDELVHLDAAARANLPLEAYARHAAIGAARSVPAWVRLLTEDEGSG